MGIKRGTWQSEGVKKSATVKSGRYGARPAKTIVNGMSNSEYHLLSRGHSPDPIVNDGLSEHRQSELIRATSAFGGGQKSASPTPLLVYSNSYKSAQEIKEKYGMVKTAGVGVSDGARFGSAGNTVRQAPEVYSPLFQIANLQLPRDRITMNAWNRNFYDTHPLVHNCINLHGTYPISKLNIKCKDRKIEQFFNEMSESMNLTSTLQSIALEFFKMGEKLQGSSVVTMFDGGVKKISDIVVGDYVLTHLGNKKMVTSVFKKPTSVVTEDHLSIRKIYVNGCSDPLVISGKHPILSTNREQFICITPSCRAKGMRVLPGKIKCSNCGKPALLNVTMPDFIYTDEAKNGDIVYSPFNNDIVDNDIFTDRLCYLIGNWLAEGSYCKAKRKLYTKLNGIKFCSYDANYAYNTIEPMLKECFGHNVKTYISESPGFILGKKKYDIWYEADYKNGPKWVEFFMEHCGEYSKHKKLSEVVMNLPVEKQLQLMSGFIDGEGCIVKNNGHLIISTSSQNLSNQFSIILRRAGVRPTISRVKSKYNNGFNYRIKLVANEAYGLFKGLLRSEKNNKLELKTWCSPQSAIKDNWQMLSIKKIEDVTDEFDEEYMYDIEVEDDHSYIANGIAVHNCFPYLELDNTNGRWKNIVIQNPDYIHIKTSVMGGEPIISMRPDAALQRLVQSNSPADKQLREQIDEEILYHVRKGNNIPLDNFHVSHLAMKSAPYDIHGTSIIVSIYKDLMLYDKLRESKFAQADNLVNPITLVKVGGNTEAEYHPTGDDLEKWRQTIEAAQYDKDFKIITHAGVSIERVGATGAIIDINNDMVQILDNILYGLMVPKAVITQEGAAFNSATVGLEILKQRYEAFRSMMSEWLIKKVFAPISEIQEFYEYKDGDKKLIVPEVEWNRMILFDMDNYINVLNQLSQANKVSQTTLFHSLGLSPEEERRLIREEMIEQTISAKEMQIVQGMSLGALRALKPDEDIIEPTEAPLPGTPGSEESGVPGAAPMGGGLGGPLGGGLGGPLGGGLGGMSPPPLGGGGGAPPPGGPPMGGGGPGGPPPPSGI